jgi:CDP-diacylglycerol--glycerol-3-phosphate 3-phosphatidyltransferase
MCIRDSAYLALSNNALMQFISALVFGLAALTDWLDGYLARKLGQESVFGATFDPLVDRIFLVISLVVLYFTISYMVPLWSVILLASRDLIMVLGWIFFKAARNTRLTVTYLGKVSTAILMISLFVLLASKSISFDAGLFMGIALFYVGLSLSVYTGIQYAFRAFFPAETTETTEPGSSKTTTSPRAPKSTD